jgi:glycosyltransferase involved in cell wall biosynthesis
MPFIENGVPLDFYFAQSGVKKDGFALCLGRICPEKGFHIALDAARRAGVGLVIGGSVFGYEEHERYFRGEIAPSLDGRKYRYVGPVGPRKKRELLRAARCLLVPSLVHETSSLVAMEAMACETPVIAFPSGALPSIVEHQTTGFLVKDAAEMADAIGRSARIDPGRCRSVAKARFSADRMVRQYLRAYRKILEGGSACTSR